MPAIWVLPLPPGIEECLWVPLDSKKKDKAAISDPFLPSPFVLEIKLIFQICGFQSSFGR